MHTLEMLPLWWQMRLMANWQGIGMTSTSLTAQVDLLDTHSNLKNLNLNPVQILEAWKLRDTWPWTELAMQNLQS